MTPYAREEQKLKIARTGQLYCLSVRYLEVNIGKSRHETKAGKLCSQANGGGEGNVA